jgi:two-component system sensor histidine kinase PilS (NtrC family)
LAQAIPAAVDLPRSLGAMPAEVTETFWRSLRYFSLYRLVVASVFMLAYVLTDGAGKLGSESGWAFALASSFYLIAAIGFLFSLAYWPRRFNLQLTVQVACDIVALGVIMYASGGAKSGVAVMLVIVVAAAGLVGQGRLTLFYAAMATLMVLGEQTVRVISLNAHAEDFLRTGLTCIGFFAAAAIAQLLSRRVVANEMLARQRGFELADQIRVNEQVVRDMDDGVLVVDDVGRVTLHNPQAAALLGAPLGADSRLVEASPALAACLASQRGGRAGPDAAVPIGIGHRQLLARFVSPEAAGKTVIYLQDFGRVQAQAQQIKLAALGRLTANIAHEIRNPLAAISHASELLAEEQRSEMRSRLIRIIGDNGARLNRLVGEILELGRRDRALPEAIPLNTFLRQFVDDYALHHDEARERIRLAGEAPGTLSFDRTHLHRVLENLVANALRYASAQAGAVVIEAVATGPGLVELHVIDDGPGIPAAERAKVFEPFFTTHSTGTGLGLYIAKELCEANAASLELVDTPTGAHFRITAKREDA